MNGPDAEEERLRILRRYEILDSPRDAAFDRIATLARRWFRARMGAVAMVDRDRIWFKSVDGMDIREVPREPGFCDATVTGSDAVHEVLDASRDPRTATHSLVTGSTGIRYYAGAPIVVGSHRLGTVCVLDSVPRPPLSPEDRRTLEDLAAIVVDELELRAGLLKRGQELLDEVEQLRRATLSNTVLGVAHDLSNNLQAAITTIEGIEETDLAEGSRQAFVDLRTTVLEAAEQIRPLIGWEDASARNRTIVSERLSRTLTLLEGSATNRERSRDLRSTRAARISPIDLDHVLMAVYEQAVKLSGEGSRIHVTCHDGPREPDDKVGGVLVGVRHPGDLPYPPGRLPRLPGSRDGGEPIGLSVAAALVGRLGGHLSVETSTNEIEWRLWLPSATVNRRVVLVEDDELVRNALVRGLSSAFDVEAYGDSVAALETVDPTEIAALVADHNLPVITGMELARSFRESAPELPVMVITGYRLESVMAEGVAFLRKPFSIEDLRIWLESVVTERDPESAAVPAPRPD